MSNDSDAVVSIPGIVTTRGWCYPIMMHPHCTSIVIWF